jgi:antitoxin FitA
LVPKWNHFALKMPTITLKNIPEQLYNRLKALAKIRHRSLNSEIIFTLEKAVGLAEEDPQTLRQQAESFRDSVLRKGQLTADEIDKAVNKGRA